MPYIRKILFWVLLSAAAVTAQQPQVKIKRLILKDGSYETILKYEVKGDRVRYLSSDRGAWEEMPDSLIDWPATRKYAQDLASGKISSAGRPPDPDEAKALAQERAEEEARSPTILPGVRLPDSGGVFLLDQFQSRRELIRMSQSSADINKNMAGNIIRGAINPISSSKQTFELNGPHARIQSHVPDPSIYLSLDAEAGSTDQNPKDRFHIVRCDEKKGNRIVGSLNIAVYGKVKQQEKLVATKVEAVSRTWLKVSPEVPLDPGEYALVELLGKEGMNLEVWDFGVNPNAPANSAAIQTKSGNEKPPVLIQKPKK